MITVEPEVYLRIMRGAIVHEIGPLSMSELGKRWERGELQGRITHYWYRPMENWAPFDPTKPLPRTIKTSFANPFSVAGPYRTERRVIQVRAAFGDATATLSAGRDSQQVLRDARSRALNELDVIVAGLRADGVENVSVALAAVRTDLSGTVFVTASGTAVRLGPPVFEEKPASQGTYR